MDISELNLWVGTLNKHNRLLVYVYDPSTQFYSDDQNVILFDVSFGELKCINRAKFKKLSIRAEHDQIIREKAIQAYKSWTAKNDEIPFGITEVEAGYRISKEYYETYLRSRKWRSLTERIKSNRDDRCEICDNRMMEALQWLISINRRRKVVIPAISRFIEAYTEPERWDLEVHHKTYERLGNELDEDLALVCFMCHTVITENAWRIGLEPAWQFSVNYASNALDQFQNIYNHLSETLPPGDYLPYQDENVNIWLRPPTDIE